MRPAAVAAGLAVAGGGGVLLGALLFGGTPPAPSAPPAPPPAPAPHPAAESEAAGSYSPTAEQLQKELTAARLALAEATRANAPKPPPIDLRAPSPEAVRGLLDTLGRQVREKDDRIRELEAEIARLKATLPEPEILRDLKSGSIDDLINLAAALRAESQTRLLTPPPSLADTYAAFLRRSSTGTARILPRGKFDHVIEKRGGGAYWSFANTDNNYNKEPDLQWEGDNFSSGFYGNSKGYFLPLGDLDPAQVGESADSPPPGLDDAGMEAWRHLWSESPFTGSEKWQDAAKPFGDWKERAEELKLSSRTPAAPGRTYLLRSMLPDEHDLLVLFHTAQQDDTGMSLVYQVLKDWKIPRRR